MKLTGSKIMMCNRLAHLYAMKTYSLSLKKKMNEYIWKVTIWNFCRLIVSSGRSFMRPVLPNSRAVHIFTLEEICLHTLVMYGSMAQKLNFLRYVQCCYRSREQTRTLSSDNPHQFSHSLPLLDCSNYPEQTCNSPWSYPQLAGATWSPHQGLNSDGLYLMYVPMKLQVHNT